MTSSGSTGFSSGSPNFPRVPLGNSNLSGTTNSNGVSSTSDGSASGAFVQPEVQQPVVQQPQGNLNLQTLMLNNPGIQQVLHYQALMSNFESDIEPYEDVFEDVETSEDGDATSDLISGVVTNKLLGRPRILREDQQEEALV
jgi:hypothetical protein